MVVSNSSSGGYSNDFFAIPYQLLLNTYYLLLNTYYLILITYYLILIT